MKLHNNGRGHCCARSFGFNTIWSVAPEVREECKELSLQHRRPAPLAQLFGIDAFTDILRAAAQTASTLSGLAAAKH